MNKKDMIDLLNHLENLVDDVDCLQQELAAKLGDSATWDSYEVFHQLDDLTSAASIASKKLQQELEEEGRSGADEYERLEAKFG